MAEAYRPPDAFTVRRILEIAGMPRGEALERASHRLASRFEVEAGLAREAESRRKNARHEKQMRDLSLALDQARQAGRTAVKTTDDADEEADS